MEKKELEELRGRVACGAVLETSGFAIDVRESTRRAVKYRRGGDIIIVIHDGQGWFDPLSDAKGDVFGLIEHLDGLPFAAALHAVADLVGFVPTEPKWQRIAHETVTDQSIEERWAGRRKPWPGSATWHYLTKERGLPGHVLRKAIKENVLREGPYGSMWAVHCDLSGAVTGWEERGPEWRGFASGGAKHVFAFGAKSASRLCVTEAAIDAMSLGALEALPGDTLYLSTGGGWSPATTKTLLMLAKQSGAKLIAASDNNRQGNVFSARLKGIAADAGAGFMRLTPKLDDWNEDLKEKEKGKGKRENAEDTCRMPAACIKGKAPSG